MVLIIKKVFLNNTYDSVIKNQLNENDLYWYNYPTKNLKN